MDLKKYTTDNLHKYAKKISDETSQKIDEHSLGKVKFFFRTETNIRWQS